MRSYHNFDMYSIWIRRSRLKTKKKSKWKQIDEENIANTRYVETKRATKFNNDMKCHYKKEAIALRKTTDDFRIINFIFRKTTSKERTKNNNNEKWIEKK